MAASAGAALLLAILPNAPPAGPPAPRCQGLAPGIEELFERGQDHLYNLEYEEALAAFDAAVAQAPDHPAPWAWKATALWMREMFRRGEFELAGYLDVSRFAEADRARARRARDAVTAELMGVVRGGLERAETWSRQPGGRHLSLYYEGLLRGIRAGYRALVLRQFFSAIGDARRAMGRHRRLLEEDPGWVDAAYTPGTFDYVVGRLPWYVRIFSTLVGLRGNADRGLAQIEEVAARGSRLRDAARVTLAVLYVREGQPLRSAALLAELHERYPRNFLLLQNRAFALAHAGRWGEALDVYGELLARVDAGVPNYDLADPVRLRLEQGQTALRAARLEVALEAYGWVLGRADTPGWARTLANVGRGQVLDLLGRRAAAIEAYRQALAGPEAGDAHRQARRFLRSPYRRAPGR